MKTTWFFLLILYFARLKRACKWGFSGIICYIATIFLRMTAIHRQKSQKKHFDTQKITRQNGSQIIVYSFLIFTEFPPRFYRNIIATLSQHYRNIRETVSRVWRIFLCSFKTVYTTFYAKIPTLRNRCFWLFKMVSKMSQKRDSLDERLNCCVAGAEETR